MATNKKAPTKKEIEELKILNGDFVDYSSLSWCDPKQKKQKRKLNFNVVWFSLGTVTGMCITAGMLICGFMIH